MFALQKDLFVAAAKNGLYRVPFVPLLLSEIINLLQSCDVSELVLYQWIIDEKSIQKITDVAAEGILFSECHVNLINLHSNASVKKNAKVTELEFSVCKIAITNINAFIQFIRSKFQKLDKLQYV